MSGGRLLWCYYQPLPESLSVRGVVRLSIAGAFSSSVLTAIVGNAIAASPAVSNHVLSNCALPSADTCRVQKVARTRENDSVPTGNARPLCPRSQLQKAL